MRTNKIAIVTEPVGVPVDVDGVSYRILDPVEVSIADLKRIEVVLPQVGALLAPSVVSHEAEQQVGALLLELTEIVMPAPKAVHAKLRNTQRISVVEAFAALLAAAAPAPAASLRPSAFATTVTH